MKDISEVTGVSITTVMRLLDTIGVEPDYKTLPEVISIDEFKGNSGGRKYHCIIVDPKERKILDILKDRKQENLSEYFKRFKDRNKVKWVIIDMWRPFSDTVKTYFKGAKNSNRQISFYKVHILGDRKCKKENTKRATRQ
ncbi:transposase IS204/IS1001/IS1096/IS1165 family protein [Thermoanaerobacter ethanolicus JW 200]|nr:transposase IS204/IS1001/IS1096/IS1165 family protein [Thermoanaerobacter ethanolicus JW 200]EGD53182.1 transposase IS204/IS1001/IS1096/IS1165 family protein [Thermoanaerobacter ethanolicus JW 200]